MIERLQRDEARVSTPRTTQRCPACAARAAAQQRGVVPGAWRGTPMLLQRVFVAVACIRKAVPQKRQVEEGSGYRIEVYAAARARAVRRVAWGAAGSVRAARAAGVVAQAVV